MSILLEFNGKVILGPSIQVSRSCLFSGNGTFWGRQSCLSLMVITHSEAVNPSQSILLEFSGNGIFWGHQSQCRSCLSLMRMGHSGAVNPRLSFLSRVGMGHSGEMVGHQIITYGFKG